MELIHRKPSTRSAQLVMLFLLVAGCGEKNHTVPSTQDNLVAALSAYSAAVVTKNGALATEYGPSTQTLSMPLSYKTVFTAKNSSSSQSTTPDKQPTTELWQSVYCTDHLRSLMDLHKIDIASAELVGADGQRRSVAVCMRTFAKNAPDDKDTGTATAGPFSSVQVCRAALSVLHRRDVSIMQGKVINGLAQVTYVRPTDSKAVSYRCKLIDGKVLTWDDSLVGARWYGDQPGDTQLGYSVSGDTLVVRDIIRGEIKKEVRFSRSDIS